MNLSFSNKPNRFVVFTFKSSVNLRIENCNFIDWVCRIDTHEVKLTLKTYWIDVMTENNISLVWKINIKRLVLLLDLIGCILRCSVNDYIVPDSYLTSVSWKSDDFFCLLINFEFNDSVRISSQISALLNIRVKEYELLLIFDPNPKVLQNDCLHIVNDQRIWSRVVWK